MRVSLHINLKMIIIINILNKYLIQQLYKFYVLKINLHMNQQHLKQIFKY